MAKKKYYLIFGLIIFLAAVLRLRGFDERYLLGSDTARDLLVARGAVALGELPRVGSFSSAGPFVFGPNWYYFLMLPIVLFPNIFLAPWWLMFLTSIFFVVIMGIIGRVVGGRRLGLILASVAAVSPAAIGLSTYLTQHGLVEIWAAVALLGFVSFLKTRRALFALLTGLGVGGAVALHYQGLYLLVYFPIMFVLAAKKSLAFWLGFLLPLGPLLLWDASRNFKNLEQLVYFYRVGQYRFWVSDRWLLYLGVFWPTFLGKILGGSMLVGAFLGLGIISSLAKISRLVFFLFCALAVQVFALRYLRSERLDGYLVYLHPLLILILGWGLWQLQKFSRSLALVVLAFLIFASLQAAAGKVLDFNNDAASLTAVTKRLEAKLPGEKLAVYGQGLATSNISYSLSLILETSGKGSDTGRPVGICLFSAKNCGFKEITSGWFQKEPFGVVDLAGREKDLTKKNGWYPFSVMAVYDDVQNWWKK